MKKETGGVLDRQEGDNYETSKVAGLLEKLPEGMRKKIEGLAEKSTSNRLSTSREINFYPFENPGITRLDVLKRNLPDVFDSVSGYIIESILRSEIKRNDAGFIVSPEDTRISKVLELIWDCRGKDKNEIIRTYEENFPFDREGAAGFQIESREHEVSQFVELVFIVEFMDKSDFYGVAERSVGMAVMAKKGRAFAQHVETREKQESIVELNKKMEGIYKDYIIESMGNSDEPAYFETNPDTELFDKAKASIVSTLADNLHFYYEEVSKTGASSSPNELDNDSILRLEKAEKEIGEGVSWLLHNNVEEV